MKMTCALRTGPVKVRTSGSNDNTGDVLLSYSF